MKRLSNKYTFRPAIFKIINDAVAKNYFFKKLNKKDKWKYNIYPSSQTIKEFK